VAVAVTGPGPTKHTANTTTTTPLPTVAPDRLDSILLSVSDVNTLMGATGMQLNGGIDHATGPGPGTVSNPDCLGTLFAGIDAVYQGSGYTGISWQELREPGNTWQHLVDQDVVSFPSADLALDFVKNSAVKWRACAGQAVNLTAGGQVFRQTFGDVVGDVPRITQPNTQEGGNGYACQHALSAVSNLVIDISACGYQISDQATQIADKMAAAATQQAH